MKDGKRLTSPRGPLGVFKEAIAFDEFGEWINDAWNTGNTMHTRFYKGWCNQKARRTCTKRVKKLARKTAS